MPNENLDILGDVVNPAKGTSLDLSADFEEPAPANPPASQQPQSQGDGKGQVVEVDDVTVDELREIVSERRATKAAESFVVDHQNDYAPIPANYQRLQAYLDANNLEFNRQNLEVAFEATKNELQKPGTRQATPPRKPSASGISDSVSQHSEPILSAEAVERHSREIPLSQLRAEIQQRAFETGKLSSRSTRFSHTLESEEI